MQHSSPTLVTNDPLRKGASAALPRMRPVASNVRMRLHPFFPALILPFFCVAVPAWTQNAPSPSAHLVAARADQYYNHLRTLTAGFVQIYRGAGVERTESGTLSLLRPGRMRWEYRQPREKLLVSDGKAVWFYVYGEKQATKGQLKQLDDLRSPLAYLLGKAHLEKQLRGLSVASDVQPLQVGNTMLRGIPLGMENQVGEVLLEIDSVGRLVRIVISQTDESVTEYRFSEIRENVALNQAAFQFVPPAGVDVVTGSLSP